MVSKSEGDLVQLSAVSSNSKTGLNLNVNANVKFKELNLVSLVSKADDEADYQCNSNGNQPSTCVVL